MTDEHALGPAIVLVEDLRRDLQLRQRPRARERIRELTERLTPLLEQLSEMDARESGLAARAEEPRASERAARRGGEPPGLVRRG